MAPKLTKRDVICPGVKLVLSSIISPIKHMIPTNKNEYK